MYKRLVSIVVFIAYSTLLIKVMVFKSVPVIKIGSLILSFGGTDAGHSANFIPFKTIVPYLFGYKGWVIAGINLVGNIALLVPVGFLLPFIFKKVAWEKSLALAVSFGFAIEVLQVVLRVGIFDIDDVILNALGVVIGCSAATIFLKWVHAKNYKNIAIAGVSVIVIGAGMLYSIYPKGQFQNHSTTRF